MSDEHGCDPASTTTWHHGLIARWWANFNVDGPVTVVCMAWLLLGVDDSPVERIVAAFIVTACVLTLLHLRPVTSDSRRWAAFGERLLQDRLA